MPRPAHAVPVPSPAPRRPREEKLPGPQDPELSCSRQCPHGEEHRQPKPAGRDPSCPSPAPRTPTAGVCPPGKAGSQAVGGSWPRQHAEARTAVLLHLQTGPEHSRAARGREGRPALARLALKDEDERSLSPPGEGPAGWWPLPAPKCSPGPSRADPGPDSSENCEESSTSGKSRPPVARHGSPRQQDRCLPGSGRPRQTPRETDRAESVTLQRPLPCWPGQRGQSASRRRLQRAPHSAQGTRWAYSMHGSPTPTHRRQRALQSMWVGDAGVTVWNPGHRATHTWLRGELS